MILRPCTISAAKEFVARTHRHNRAPQGGLFAVSVEHAGVVVAVAIVGRPVARMLQDGWTAEITRVASDGTKNACSMLYGACRTAAKALGYRRLFTYTLETEPGTSLHAAAFHKDKAIDAMPTWDRPSRRRAQTDEFGEKRPTCAKVRWIAVLR